MKHFLPLLVLFSLVQLNSSAKDIKPYKGKTFIFDVYSQAEECDIVGTIITPYILILKGSLFTVEAVTSRGDLVIKFLPWKKNKNNNKNKTNNTNNNYAIYNAGPVESDDDDNESPKSEKFFLLPKATFEAACSEYHKEDKWTIGVLTSPFKIRHKPFLFTTNLNLGTSISYKQKFYKDYSIGVVLGLSLSSVTLDSLSTKGFVKTPSERPALTPSIHGMIGYKNINITIGFGWDYINKPSKIEESWRYHGKSWFGIGIGVSLFNSNRESNSTTPSQF